MPVLTLNQARLVLRIALAHGEPVDSGARPSSSPASSARASASARSRASCSTLVPVAGWAVKGGVAYAGTRAVGEAARAPLRGALAV